MALELGDVLGKAMVHIDRAAALLGEELPYLSTIVIDKSGLAKICLATALRGAGRTIHTFPARRRPTASNLNICS
jgi:hypothetical protein